MELRPLVAAGLGVAILAGTSVDVPGPAIAVRPLRPEPAHPPIAVIHHRERRLSPAAHACRDLLASCARD